MNLRLTREPTTPLGTIGSLTLEGEIGRVAWTLEDRVREIPGEPVETWKVSSDTAIPVGRYRIAITYSPRFRRRMPLLMNVRGFDGIRIHWGNSAADTIGCILVGQSRQGTDLLFSRAAFDPLYLRIETALLATEEVWISVS